jgi:hypothetical protein
VPPPQVRRNLPERSRQREGGTIASCGERHPLGLYYMGCSGSAPRLGVSRRCTAVCQATTHSCVCVAAAGTPTRAQPPSSLRHAEAWRRSPAARGDVVQGAGGGVRGAARRGVRAQGGPHARGAAGAAKRASASSSRAAESSRSLAERQHPTGRERVGSPNADTSRTDLAHALGLLSRWRRLAKPCQTRFADAFCGTGRPPSQYRIVAASRPPRRPKAALEKGLGRPYCRCAGH